MSSSSELENSLSENEDVEEAERTNIRERLSTLSFEDLLKMKEQMGSKLYNSTVFGVSKSKSKKDFKRANKNRPREMSSKIRRVKLETSVVSTAKKSIPRDPRFDPLCGQFDENTFKSNYKFVDEFRVKEIKELEKELKTCTDEGRKKTIKLLIQRMNNQLRERQKREKEKKKQYEEQMEIREKLKRGERPVFKKKSVKKLENLIDKFEELKKTSKLQKHIEKRSKKLTKREIIKLKNS